MGESAWQVSSCKTVLQGHEGWHLEKQSVIGMGSDAIELALLGPVVPHASHLCKYTPSCIDLSKVGQA